MASLRKCQHVYEPIDALFRYHALQKICHLEDPSIEAILFIGGPDGKHNVHTAKVFNYLFLGVSGFDLSHPQLVDDDLEETVVIIHRNGVKLFAPPSVLKKYGHLMSLWDNMNVYTLPEEEFNEDVDAAEEFKIRSFLTMVDELGTVGVPLSQRQGTVDVFEIEMWPLVQAYGLEEVGGKGGFFTMHHSVCDVSCFLDAIFRQVDGQTLKVMKVFPLEQLSSQWESVLTIIDRRPVDDIREKLLSEPLESYYRYGLRDGFVEIRPLISPRVCFGTNSNDPSHQSDDSKMTDPILHPSSSNFNGINILVQAMDPRWPIHCTRTYFVGVGTLPLDAYNPEERMVIDEDRIKRFQKYRGERIRAMSRIYHALVFSARKSASQVLRNPNVDLDFLVKQTVRDIERRVLRHDECRDLLGSYDFQGHVDITIYVDDCGHYVGANHYEASLQGSGRIFFLEAKARDLPGIGTIAYGDMFAIHSDRMMNLTASIPAINHFVRFGVEREAESTLQHIQSHPLLGKEVGDPFQSTTIFMDSQLELLPSLKGTLRFFSSGVIFTHERMGSFGFSFENHASSIHVFHNGMNGSMFIQMTHNDELSLFGFTDLVAANRFCIHVPPRSSMKRLVDKTILAMWKESAGKFDIEWSELTGKPFYVPEAECRENSDEILKLGGSFGELLSDAGDMFKPEKISSRLDEFFRFSKEFNHGRCFSDSSLSSPSSTSPHSLPDADVRIPVVVVTSLFSSAISTFGKSVSELEEEKCELTTVSAVNKNEKECVSSFSDVVSSMTNGLQDATHSSLHRRRRIMVLSPSATNVPKLCYELELICQSLLRAEGKIKVHIYISSVITIVHEAAVMRRHWEPYAAIQSSIHPGYCTHIALFDSTDDSKPTRVVKEYVHTVLPHSCMIHLKNGRLFLPSDYALITEKDRYMDERMRTMREVDRDATLFSEKPSEIRTFSVETCCKFDASKLLDGPFDRLLEVELHLSVKADGEESTVLHLHNIRGTTCSKNVQKYRDGEFHGQVRFSWFEYDTFSKQTENGVEGFLQDWLRSALGGDHTIQPIRTRKSLSEQELMTIRSSRLSEPLPAGYVFDGKHFIDFYGDSSLMHPEMDRFIEEYLKEQNAAIQEHNVIAQAAIDF
eukprot:TRINITY_DN255_c0_g1_i1.p1 TRINITY_DN255_c0_g1~~TRINITY_DN255_c0_g1_i1.p1  ORF type:complete len:1131 (+),score=309.94 TRINITY_DN255_c0_g1_i1:74-3466(+)